MKNSTTDAQSALAPVGCLLRLFWMLAGNGILYISLILIARKHAPLPSYLDAVAAAAVLTMIVARRVDITQFAGRTIQDDPATLAHWRRFAGVLVAVATLSWLFAHYLSGNFSG